MADVLTRQLQDALDRKRGSIEAGDGIPLAAARLMATAEAIAHALRHRHLTAREPVLCRIANQPLDLAALLGVWLAGGVAVPVHRAAPTAMVVDLRARTGARFSVLAGQLEQTASGPPPAARALLSEAALIVFTSGSTGKPKGVVLGHRQLAGKLLVLDRLLKFGTDEVVVVPLQLTFIFGIWVSLLSVLTGAHLVLLEKFKVDAVAQKLAAGATVLAGVPSMLRSLFTHVRAPPAPRLRRLLCGGETLGRRLGAEAALAFPRTEIFDLYGLTETGSCDFCLLPGEFAAGLGTIGGATPQVSWRIVADDGRPADTGRAGELLIKTPFGMLGYLDDPTLSAGAYQEGYFRSGDQARLRPDGRVEIVGRLKDLIVRGGNKIAPAEIDALLSTHPQVAGALCAGVPHARLGEAILAAVVLVPGARLTPEVLRSWAATRIEPFKVPDLIVIRPALPTSATGKLDRRAIAGLAEPAAD
jgi:acyl-CoA synthetase (AMP-forming)/AMP-acid ligase II